jgi:hypothetical protein
MKTTKNYIQNAWSYIAQLVTAIVSGLPREKVVFKPEAQIIMHKQKQNYKPDTDKHYHRPMAKPAVEKQTMLKEKKKAKATH